MALMIYCRGVQTVASRPNAAHEGLRFLNRVRPAKVSHVFEAFDKIWEEQIKRFEHNEYGKRIA